MKTRGVTRDEITAIVTDINSVLAGEALPKLEEIKQDFSDLMNSCDSEKLAAFYFEVFKKIKKDSPLIIYTDAKAISIGKYFGFKDGAADFAYMQKPLGVWPGKAQEALSIYRSDIEKRQAMAKECQQVEGNNIPEWKLEKLHSDIVKMQEKTEFHISSKEQKAPVDKMHEEKQIAEAKSKQASQKI